MWHQALQKLRATIIFEPRSQLNLAIFKIAAETLCDEEHQSYELIRN